MAGSMDDHPPVILSADDYEFCLVGYAGDSFACYRSTRSNLTKDRLLARLRTIMDALEQLEL